MEALCLQTIKFGYLLSLTQCIEWCEASKNDKFDWKTADKDTVMKLLASFQQFIVAAYKPSTVYNLQVCLRRYLYNTYGHDVESYEWWWGGGFFFISSISFGS